MRFVDAVRDMRTIRQLLTRAESEARSGGERTPGPEHLLLAATTLPDGTAASALERVGIDLQRLRSAIEGVHASALAAVGIDVEPGPERTAGLREPASGAFDATPHGRQVFKEAVALSKAVRPSVLRGAHVVAAVCDLEHGTAARALAALEVDRGRLRDAARAEVGLDRATDRET